MTSSSTEVTISLMYQHHGNNHQISYNGNCNLLHKYPDSSMKQHAEYTQVVLVVVKVCRVQVLDLLYVKMHQNLVSRHKHPILVIMAKFQLTVSKFIDEKTDK